MNASVPIRTLTNGVFGYDQRSRPSLVLKAFFDDSGTHAGSDAVVMGGLLADEQEWDTLEPEWAAFRDRLGIRKMRMSACERRQKDFENWDRDERDRAIDGFREIIVKRQALMLVSTVSRAAFAEAAEKVPLLSELFPNPIDLCFQDCVQRAMRWRPSEAPQPVAVTFDSREESLAFWGRRADGFEKRFPEQLAGISFSSMEEVLPLQAADMIAYEAFVFQCAREKGGGVEPVPRRNFRLLLERIQLAGGFYRPEQLIAYAENIREAAANMPN